MARRRWYEFRQKDLEKIPVIGGLFGDSSPYDERAEDKLNDALSGYDNVEPVAPYVSDEWLADYQATAQGNTEFDNITIDPRLKQAQMDALSSLQDISKNGMTLQDKANLEKIRGDIEQSDKSRRDALLQQAHATGSANSNKTLMAMLDSAQDATNRGSERSMDVAAMSQARALDAMQRAGSMATGYRDQDFSEQAARATAQDTINRFNTGNTNEAAKYNNAGRQGVQSSNVAGQNTYNQNKFDNSMAVASGKAGVLGAQSDQAQMIADRKEKAKGEALGNLIRGGAAYMSGGASEAAPAAAGAVQGQPAPAQSSGFSYGEQRPGRKYKGYV